MVDIGSSRSTSVNNAIINCPDLVLCDIESDSQGISSSNIIGGIGSIITIYGDRWSFTNSIINATFSSSLTVETGSIPPAFVDSNIYCPVDAVSNRYINYHHNLSWFVYSLD